MPTQAGRSYVAGNFMLELDGKELGFLKSADGGAAVGEVVSVPASPGGFTRKHLGSVRYEEMTFQLGLNLDRSVYTWIAETWQMNYTRKSGAVVAADYRNDVKNRFEFRDALMTEVTIPAMDGSSRDAAYLEIKIQPDYTKNLGASGKLGAVPSSKAVQKSWLPSNFRLEINGLDCTKVSRIDSFAVKVTSVSDDIGETRAYQNEPARIEFPNLRILFSETHAQSWMTWYEDFVIKGNSGESSEKSGALTFLSANLQTELATIRFSNLGIFRLTPEKIEAHSEQIRRVIAELYCERMEFEMK